MIFQLLHVDVIALNLQTLSFAVLQRAQLNPHR
jgi:hypothetical protein